LVFAEAFDDVSEAIAMEKRLKKWRRSWKVQLIEKSNPEWYDLMAP
jgi:putative endonuclease